MTIRALTPWSWGKKTTPVAQDEIEPLFSSLHRQMNRLFDEVSREFDLVPFGFGDGAAGSFHPRLDLVEREKDYQVTLELPGMSEKDIDLTLKEGILTIKGEKKEEHRAKSDNVYRMERTYGAFQRTIALPSEVKEEEIEAKFNKGVLTITLPKAEEAQKAVRHIEVKAA